MRSASRASRPARAGGRGGVDCASGSDTAEVATCTTPWAPAWRRGAEAAGLAEYDRAGDLARGNTKIELRYFINYSDVLHLTGRYQDAVDQALAGIELARSKGLERSIGAMLAGNAAEPMLALGQWDRAVRDDQARAGA